MEVDQASNWIRANFLITKSHKSKYNGRLQAETEKEERTEKRSKL